MKITVICPPPCGNRMVLAREIVTPEAFIVVCSACEFVHRCHVTADQLVGQVADPAFWSKWN